MSSPEEVEVGEAAAASAAAVEKPPPSNENLEEPKAEEVRNVFETGGIH